ncbi:MAG: tyrosine-type recombinase/integrase, partial [Planctomycetes bacterium]|nr:tyrosine-type recombinase/integrase [Planctomycetota bacterium]
MERFLLRAANRKCALMRSARPWLSVAVNLQAALQAFLLQLRADGRSEHTVGQYRRHGNALVAWLAATGTGTDVADLTPTVLATFFASDAARSSCRGGPKKATSTNAMRTSVRCFAAHLHLSGLVAQNPARMLRRARCTAPAPRALHADEQERLLAVLAAATGGEAERDRVLVRLLLGTGVRLGSALALDVSDLDFAHGELAMRCTKNDKPAVVMLPKALGEELRRFVAGRKGPVFLAKDARISTRHAQRRLAGWFAKARITGKSAHSIRHAFATDLLARTGDLRLVHAAQNHASIDSTTIYTAVDRARLR